MCSRQLKKKSSIIMYDNNKCPKSGGDKGISERGQHDDGGFRKLVEFKLNLGGWAAYR